MITREENDDCGCSDGLSKRKSLKYLALHHDVDMKSLLRELLKGTKVEKEHTDSAKIAMKIAYDHLEEDPKYYTKLHKMENK